MGTKRIILAALVVLMILFAANSARAQKNKHVSSKEAVVENLQKKVQRLIDNEDISNLKMQYFNYCDCGWGPLGRPMDAEKLAMLFAEDGIWDLGASGKAVGRVQIVELMKKFYNAETGISLNFHLGGNPIIQVNGDKATGEWHGLFAFSSGPKLENATWMSGRYQDQFIRTPEGWKFKYLKLDLAFTSPVPQGFKPY